MFDHFQFTLIHGPKIPGSCAILFFIASDFTSITNHIRNWALFLLSLHIPILSRVVSALFTSSISDTYWPGEFIFQWPIFLPFHTVHDLLKARILKWFAFLQWTTFCQNSPLWPVHLGWPYTAWLIVSLNWTQLFSLWWVWLIFCDCGFHCVCPLMDEDKRLMEASRWEGLVVGKTGSCSGGQVHVW